MEDSGTKHNAHLCLWPVDERRTWGQRDAPAEERDISGCVQDPTVALSVPGAKRHLLLSSWVAHAGTGWLMWLLWVGDSACNQAPACNHLLLLFICNFTERQSCCQSLRAPVSGRGRRKAGVCMKEEGGQEGCCATSIPRGFPLRCQERYVSGRCLGAKLSTSTNCGSLCLTKAPLLFCPPPSKVGSSPERYVSRAIPWQTCVSVGLKQAPFYASLAYGVDLLMGELDTFLSEPGFRCRITKLLNRTENAFFQEPPPGGYQRAACLRAAHAPVSLNKYVIRSAHKIFILWLQPPVFKTS